MLAYRHAFHAGNHADVLKHLVLMQVLEHLNAKPKGWRFVDSHAGAGGYSLEGRYARKKSEFADGIGRLWMREDLPAPLAAYADLVRRFNPQGGLEQYPGSPAIAQMLARPQDQLCLAELHPTDHRILAAAFAGDRRVQVRHGDGFDALKAWLPPPTRRGALLIDPSYEGDRDYARVLAALREALARFADGVHMVWVPQVAKVIAAELPRRIEALAQSHGRPWLHARLTVARPDAVGFGLAGSSMVVINPPHTLHDTLAGVLPWLAQVLGRVDGASHRLERRGA